LRSAETNYWLKSKFRNSNNKTAPELQNSPVRFLYNILRLVYN